MNFYEAQDFFKQMHPDKLVTFEFDRKCIRQIEAVHTDGEIHDINHIEYRQVKVTPQDMPSVYVPIQPHRMCITADELKKHVFEVSIRKV
jgi:hypothetical protein